MKHQKFSDIAAIVAPIAQLVGQNLLATDAALAREAGEPLKISASVHASNPALGQGLAALANWSAEHHRKSHAHAHSNAAAAPPIAPPAVSS